MKVRLILEVDYEVPDTDEDRMTQYETTDILEMWNLDMENNPVDTLLDGIDIVSVKVKYDVP